MTYQRLEIITGTQRRRRFSAAEKLRVVEEAFRPGVVASEVARRNGINASLLYRWRRQLVGPPAAVPGFAAVTLAASPALASQATGLIEIELATGTRVRISGSVDPAVVSAALGALCPGGER